MSNKFLFKGSSIYNVKGDDRLTTTIFYYGKVVSNIDELGASRIIARIVGIDDELSNSDLSDAFPMVQKFLHVIPKIGETVLIFIPDMKNPNIDRLYIGPIISQPQKLKRDSELFSAKSALGSGITKPDPSPDTVPENRGVYPNVDDIAIQGRFNSDIILKENQVLLRAGQFENNTVPGDIPLFNKVNPSFIQIVNDTLFKVSDENNDEERGGAINVVSNKINLLTHKNGSPRFDLADQDSMISEDEMTKIISEAHQLVFGDKLIEFLILQRAAFANHAHAYPGMKPQDLQGATDIDKYLDFNLKSLLSKNIRIN